MILLNNKKNTFSNYFSAPVVVLAALCLLSIIPEGLAETAAGAESKTQGKIQKTLELSSAIESKVAGVAQAMGSNPKGKGTGGETAMAVKDTAVAFVNSYECNKDSGFYGLPSMLMPIQKQFPGVTPTTGAPIGFCYKSYGTYWSGCSIWHIAFVAEYLFPVGRIETSEQRYDSLRTEGSIMKVYEKANDSFLPLIKMDQQLRQMYVNVKAMGVGGYMSAFSDGMGEIFDGAQNDLKNIDANYRHRSDAGTSIDYSQIPELAEIAASNMDWIPHKSHTQKPFWWSASPIMYPLTSTYTLTFSMFPKVSKNFLTPFGEGICTSKNVETGRTPAEFAGPYAPSSINSMFSGIPGGNQLQGQVNNQVNKIPGMSMLNNSEDKNTCLKNIGRILPLNYAMGFNSQTDVTFAGVARSILTYNGQGSQIFDKGRMRDFRPGKDKLNFVSEEFMTKNVKGCYDNVEKMVKVPLELPPGAKKPGETFITGLHEYRRFKGTHGWADYEEPYWLVPADGCPAFCVQGMTKLPGFFSTS